MKKIILLAVFALGTMLSFAQSSEHVLINKYKYKNKKKGWVKKEMQDPIIIKINEDESYILYKSKTKIEVYEIIGVEISQTEETIDTQYILMSSKGYYMTLMVAESVDKSLLNQVYIESLTEYLSYDIKDY